MKLHPYKEDEFIKGEHYWAYFKDEKELVIVLYQGEDFFDVCGAWECGTGKKDIEIISKIDKPEGFKGVYYERIQMDDLS